MRKRSFLFVFIAALALVVVPLSAQDENIPGPGEGAPIIWPNLGEDIKTLNPILASDGSSGDVIEQIFPAFIGVDGETLSYQPNVPGSLATGWELSEDSLTYTITIRDDLTWSDGTPVTADDVIYSYEAIASGETNTPLAYVLDDVADMTAINDYTIEVTLRSPSCDAFANVAAVPVVPSHVYSQVFPTFADMNENEFNLSDPGATARGWTFSNFRPGEQVTLLADPTYNDAPLTGYTVPAGWIYKNVADQTLIVEQFLNGDLSVVASVPGSREEEIIELGEAGEIQVGFGPSITVRFIGLNSGNPDNVQPGFEDLDGDNARDEGEPLIEQEPHPILGNVNVRQALMYAMDWEALDIGAFGGGDVQLASHWLPQQWVFNQEEVPPYPYDVEQARQLLTEAGWIDDDSDEGTTATPTPRVAQGVPNVEDGTPLAFELLTNAGSTENEATGILLTDQWAQVGVDLDFQALDFNILVDELLGQTYDAIMLFWQLGSVAAPDQDIRTTFSPANDLPGQGFNSTSYYNERLMEILEMANDPAQTNNCDQDVRREMYTEAYQILRDDVAWMWLGASTVYSALQPDVDNLTVYTGPGRLSIANQEEAWIIPNE